MEIKYKGKVVGKITDKGIIEFIGPDLNPVIDEAIGAIAEVEDDYGNIVFEKTIPELALKMIYMVEELGFEIAEYTEVKKKSLDDDVPIKTELEKKLMSNYKDLEKQIIELVG